MAAMNWSEFEEKAGRAIPAQPLKARRCWIGVLLHNKDPQQPLNELDFIWMIGHSKISLEKIYDTYAKVSGSADFLLVGQDGVVQREKVLREIASATSELVVFQAVGPTSTSPSAASPASPALPPPPVEDAQSNYTPRDTVPDTTQSIDGSHRIGVLPAPNTGSNESRASPRVHTNASWRPANDYLRETSQDGHSASPPTPLASVTAVTPAHSINHPIIKEPRFHRPGYFAVPSTAVKEERPLSSPHVPIDRMTGAGSPSRNPLQQLQPNAAQTNGVSAPEISHARSIKPESHSPPVFHNEVEEEPAQPFDAGNFFKREVSPDQNVHGEGKPTDDFIRNIIGQDNPEVLEAGVQQSLKVLDAFKQSFSTYTSSLDAHAWVQSIDKLIPQAKRKRTVVGVFGNTGAGKSSVINALLDEERLVPTNCMRACTAVVTEMSWNDSTDPSSKYRAEIEFISRADWEKEVATLMKEFLTESGTLQREASDQSTDAGIAWAKFHAVHPKVARDELGDCTVARLMSDKGLDVLGTTKKIDSSSPQRFYQELQKYVDSKEKVTKKDKKDTSNRLPFAMEFWPLIKVVKIYTKAPALSTGAVIVDLPGVHDSNAARAAVAQGYMKQCTGLWIVAPITRAVDDKAAKTLLGDSFKMQLKYDGGFSSVTFICSKTDDISITEAIDTLELEEQVESLYRQQNELEKEIQNSKDKVEELKESQAVYQQAAREAAEAIEVWEELKDQYDDGKDVFAPAPKAVKRKKNSSANKSRKKHQVDAEDSDADFIVDDDEEDASDINDADDEEIQAPKEPLTEDEIKEKIKELRETRKNARREGLEMKPKIEELRPLVREAQNKIKAIKAEISRICISGRNDYSKEAIQNDFAAGIKELDQENAAEEDEDNFNPDEEKRDYDQVARSLPVFCVSSRAYQKLCGRLQKDDAVPGFNTLEETEMPQLQKHCKKLTEAGRVQSCRNFLLSVCQLLTTFALWASNDGSGLQMTADDKQNQVRYVDRRLNELEGGLEACVKACLNTMKRELNDQIFDKYPDLIQDAIAAAPNTAARWGAHRNDGGLYWATYKAVVRRFGVYHSSSAGHRDFNLELVEPIVNKLATGWERVFQNRLPKAFATFIADSGKVLHKFHEAVELRARENGVGLASLSTLKTQIYTYEMLFGELNQLLVARMTELQREANRDFAPTVLGIMQTVYEICTDERGQGSFKRMKAAMSEYVERHRHHMFNQATMTVKRHLDAMCRSLQELMEERADEIYIKMKADYMRVLGGIQINQETVMSREERTIRSDIMSQLRAVDSQFESISKGELALGNADVNDEDANNEDEPADDDDESAAFESAHESAPDDSTMQDSIMRDNDDTDMAQPSLGLSKKPALPTPSSNEVSGTEL